MSRTKRTFTAEFKAKVVLEVIKGEKTINEIAAENSLNPNMIRNWKEAFIRNASTVFDTSIEYNAREKLVESRKETDRYAKKVGQLTMEVDWLKKKSEELFGPDWESKYTKKPFED